MILPEMERHSRPFIEFIPVGSQDQTIVRMDIRGKEDQAHTEDPWVRPALIKRFPRGRTKK